MNGSKKMSQNQVKYRPSKSLISFLSNIDAIAQNYEQISPLLERAIEHFKFDPGDIRKYDDQNRKKQLLQNRSILNRDQCIILWISHFEWYLQNLLFCIWSYLPKLMKTKPRKSRKNGGKKKEIGIESDLLFSFIHESTERDEIIIKIIRAKLRSYNLYSMIEYLRDELNIMFQSHRADSIDKLRKIRNILVHNQRTIPPKTITKISSQGWEVDPDSREIIISEEKLDESFTLIREFAYEIDRQITEKFAFIPKTTDRAFEFYSLECPLCQEKLERTQKLFFK